MQGKALAEIKAKGVHVPLLAQGDARPLPQKTWDEVAKEQAAKSPEFKKAWDSYSKFRDEYKIWKQFGYLKE